MKSVFYGIAAMVVVSFIAWGMSGAISTSSGEQFASENNSVRLD